MKVHAAVILCLRLGKRYLWRISPTRTERRCQQMRAQTNIMMRALPLLHDHLIICVYCGLLSTVALARYLVQVLQIEFYFIRLSSLHYNSAIVEVVASKNSWGSVITSATLRNTSSVQHPLNYKFYYAVYGRCTPSVYGRRCS